MMINIENSVGLPTSIVASSMIFNRVRKSTSSRCSANLRNTFSTTITAPSTMMPKSIAPSDSRLAGIPIQVSPRKVPSSDNGIISATIVAARMLPRKISSTSATSIAPSTRLVNTVFKVLPISQLRS